MISLAFSGGASTGTVDARSGVENETTSRRIKIFFMREKFSSMNFAQRRMGKKNLFLPKVEDA
jgi:hypothetical protein